MTFTDWLITRLRVEPGLSDLVLGGDTQGTDPALIDVGPDYWIMKARQSGDNEAVVALYAAAKEYKEVTGGC